MGRVLAAPAAELAELDAVRIVPLGLHRLVVAPPALSAGERDRNSDSGLRHESLSTLGRLTHRLSGGRSVAGPGADGPSRAATDRSHRNRQAIEAVCGADDGGAPCR